MNTINFRFQNIIMVISTLILLYSCQEKENVIALQEQATLKLNIEGLNFESDTELLASSMKSPDEDVAGQVAMHYTNDGLTIESKLSDATQPNTNLKKLKSNASAALKQLQDKIKYILIVYDDKGKLVTSKEYTYKTETLETAVPLNSNVNYTFIVVSARSTNFVPVIKNMASLNEASIENVNADLLYWKKTMALKKGDNFLAANLKPLFSEVTITLQMDPNMTGSITSISTPKFHPITNGVSLKLENGTATYGSINSSGKTVEFPALGKGSREVTSTPTTLLHSTTSKGYLNFGAIQVDGEIKSNIKVENLNIKPGHRYDLVLTLKTCTKDVIGNSGLNWNYPESKEWDWKENKWQTGIYIDNKFYKNGSQITRTYTEKGADYGFVFDIVELDNSINFEVNNIKMANKEIQFQSNAMTPQNIEFVDGSQYQGTNTEGGTIPAIWTMTGTTANPIVKIVISRFGEVTMFGSKKSGGKLYPLRLKSGTSFNTFVWAPGSSQSNTVKVTSIVDGQTIIKGTGSGKIKISCTK